MTSSHTPHARQTILIVDDTPDNIDVLTEVLAPHYVTKVALNGEKALRIAAGENRPDLILLDIMMPGIDGYGVLEHLKATRETSHIPLIFLSAKGSDREIWEGWQSGADYYLTKPFDPDELLTYLRYVESAAGLTDA